MNLLKTPSSQKLTAKVRASLARASSYREFLQIYFESTGLSYAEVARRAGFSSRSYPRDVVEGRRRLTVKALPALLRGLRLESELARLIQYLYFAEYPDEHPEALSRAAIQQVLEQQRAAASRSGRGPVRKKLRSPKSPASEGMSVFAEGLLDVIAALGDGDLGVTLEDIHKRTGLAKPLIAGKLEQLVAEGVVTYHADSRRFMPGARHLDWTGEPGNSLAQEAYCSSLGRLQSAAREHFASTEAMFLNSAISVSKADLPRLKTELRELILKFVDRTVETERNEETVVQIVTGLFEGRIAVRG